MPMEHYRPNGALAAGYYCYNCGEPCAMMGHRRGWGWACLPAPKLVKQLQRANVAVTATTKPHFTYGGKIHVYHH